MSWRKIDARHWESTSHVALVDGTAAQARIAGPDGVPMALLLVWRKDGKPLGDEHFNVLQSAKEAVFGPDVWAAEMYPPRTQLRDRANVYWLQVFAQPGYQPSWVKLQRPDVAPAMRRQARTHLAQE